MNCRLATEPAVDFGVRRVAGDVFREDVGDAAAEGIVDTGGRTGGDRKVLCGGAYANARENGRARGR